MPYPLCGRMSESQQLSDWLPALHVSRGLYHSFTCVDAGTRLRTTIGGGATDGRKTRQVSDIVLPRDELVLLNRLSEDS